MTKFGPREIDMPFRPIPLNVPQGMKKLSPPLLKLLQLRSRLIEADLGRHGIKTKYWNEN